ncbi:MAG: hypothetical protein LC751_14665 [Actinobacteria bacterium]|nr:hypothetical protein [Actinomycetota bacterium]MCA1740084.1 hypothetical protein [Actinomycetota bacterium]
MNEYREMFDDEPTAVPIDLEGQQRELEAAGWGREEHQGKLLWRHPVSGHLYPQGPAYNRLKIDLDNEDSQSDA